VAWLRLEDRSRSIQVDLVADVKSKRQVDCRLEGRRQPGLAIPLDRLVTHGLVHRPAETS
jgi:hypothetical protein